MWVEAEITNGLVRGSELRKYTIGSSSFYPENHVPSNMDRSLRKQMVILDIPYGQSKFCVLLSTHPVSVNETLWKK